MRSSTLYGPVTKVTAGKYFAQVANKGLDKTGKEKGSKGHGKWKCGEKEKMRRRAEHQEEGKNTSALWTMRREDVPHSTHTVPLPCICILYCLFSFPYHFLFLSCSLHNCTYCNAVSRTNPHKHPIRTFCTMRHGPFPFIFMHQERTMWFWPGNNCRLGLEHFHQGVTRFVIPSKRE